MGFLDRFKKKEEKIIPQKESKPFEVEFAATNDGRLQVDFQDLKADFKQFYDTTRLIVNGEPLNLAGQEVYNCIVSWYSKNDTEILDEKIGKMVNHDAINYRGILAQIDLNLLQTDSEYCYVVMKNLLNKKRVEKYLATGLQETPEQPCGKYIGGVRQTENGYGKFFSTIIGKASHNSNLMIKRRQEKRALDEEKKQKAIDDKKAQIDKLQEEIDELYK